MAKESEYRKDKLKAQVGLYVPRADEYKPRAKTYLEKKAKGLIKENPGIKTEQGEIFKKQLEDLTGQKQDQIGTYTEAPGGGTPLARGTKAPSDEWVQEHRKMQPRDPKTGQFEYNNANAKGTKYPSRGEKTPMFLEGDDFTRIFDEIRGTERSIITEDGKNAVARLDMTEGEFKEALINASEHLGFTTRWNVREGNSKTAKKTNENLFDYKNDLSKAQERAIAANDSDKSKFNGNLESMLLTKKYQRENKDKEHERSEARNQRDEILNSKWRSGNIDDAMIQAVKDVYPVKAFETAKDPKEVVQKVMDMKNDKGEKRFKTFEDFRHWTIGNRNRGWFK